MNIVIPMAGLGSRFSSAGFVSPKPLILVASKPMYRYAVDCLPLTLAKKLVFILLKNDFVDALIQDIETHYKSICNLSIIVLDKETQGQAETILQSAQHLDIKEPTLIHNCDTYFEKMFNWESLLYKKIDGAIVVFLSNEKRWSYVEINNEKNQIISMKEKEVISSHATTGTYFFKDTKKLLERITYLIKKNIKEYNEYYLSSIYQMMLQSNETIIPLETKRILCFGTPYDLVNSLNLILADGIRI